MSAVVVRPVEKSDAAAWMRMRHLLWPPGVEEAGMHAREVERFFARESREPLAVMLAVDPSGAAVGFLELSIRAYVEGCETDRVAFVEGWYVDPAARGEGVGAALMRAAEAWARAQGCTELGSDAEADNLASAEAHRALGFTETGLIRCFIKSV